MRRIRETLRILRNDCVRREYGEALQDCPDRFLAALSGVGGAGEHLRVLERLIGKTPSRILVVGVFGGRDYWGLRTMGHLVSGLNLTPEPDCPGTLVGDAEEVWPFPDGQFDFVIMGEVLEHLLLDLFALGEARRVLVKDGGLVVTVPFLNDAPEFHVRVHTPLSIRRLLGCAGFEVVEYVERPGLPFKLTIRRLLDSMMLARRVMLGSSRYRPVVEHLGDLEWLLGKQFNMLRRAAGLFQLNDWGCTILARRSLVADYKSANADAFAAAPLASSNGDRVPRWPG